MRSQHIIKRFLWFQCSRDNWVASLTVYPWYQNCVLVWGFLRILFTHKYPLLGGGNSNISYFHLKNCGHDPILTSIVFKCVGNNHHLDHFSGSYVGISHRGRSFYVLPSGLRTWFEGAKTVWHTLVQVVNPGVRWSRGNSHGGWREVPN